MEKGEPLYTPGGNTDWCRLVQIGTEAVLWNREPEICAILLDSVTHINLIKRKKEKGN